MPAEPLSSRKERFAYFLAEGCSASEAHEKAGYSKDRGNASRLQHDASIQQRVAELLEEKRQIAHKAAQKAMDELAIDKKWILGKLVENVERGLQARAVLDDDGKPIGEYRYDGSVVNKSLELLGKERGMFIERKESGAPGDFAQLDSAEAILEVVGRELGADVAEMLKPLIERSKALPDATNEAPPEVQ